MIRFVKEFSGMQNPPIGWFFAPSARNTRTDDAMDIWTSHGSCVASKAVGRTYGVSKKSNLIVLKVTYAIEDLIWALFTAHKNILDNNRQKRSVITFAFATAEPAEDDHAALRMKEIMGYLFDIDAVIVVPAGNYANSYSTEIDRAPGIWEDRNFPLIVVGAASPNGLSYPPSQDGNHLSTTAPGYSVQCALKDGGFTLTSGTSLATALVISLLGFHEAE